MKYICEHCRNQVSDSQKFCGSCGMKLQNVNDMNDKNIYDQVGDPREEGGRFQDEVESYDYVVTYSDMGDTVDLKDFDKAKDQFMNMWESEYGRREEDIISEFNLNTENWDRDRDPLAEHPDVERVVADNTYNSAYIPPDAEFGVLRIEDEDGIDVYIPYVSIHLGGDIRGNYSELFFSNENFSDQENAQYDVAEKLFIGTIHLNIKFKDGSELMFDSEQIEDVEYFELYESSGYGVADDVVEIFNEYIPPSTDGDEFLLEVVDHI